MKKTWRHEQCTFCESNRTDNSLLCRPHLALQDMRNAVLGFFNPATLADFLTTIRTHKVHSLSELQKLAEDRNAYQLAGLAKRLRTLEGRDNNTNLFPRLVESLQAVSDWTTKNQNGK